MFSKSYFRNVTISNASPAVFTCTDHGLYPGDVIILNTTDTLPTGLTASTGNTTKKYYVVRNGLTTSTFQVSASEDNDNYAGTPVNTSSAGSGTHSFLKIDRASLKPYQEDDEDII